MQKSPLQEGASNDNRKRRQAPHWLYSVIVIIIAASIGIGAVFWILSGQGTLATVISVVFTALGLVFSFLQAFPFKKHNATTDNVSPSAHLVIHVSQPTSSIQALSDPSKEEHLSQSNTAKVISSTVEPPNTSKSTNFIDWGEAPSADHFYGRDAEFGALEKWILSDNCRVVLLQGVGGIGKTTLAAKVTEQVKGEFEYVFWRSLKNALPLNNLLKQCIFFFSNQKEISVIIDANDPISTLIKYLKEHRCLLILDNLETILQANTYIKGYEDYEELLHRIGVSEHQSCLLLTSREKPGGLASLEGKISPVRVKRLSGLKVAEGRKLLKDLDLQGSDEAWEELIRFYSGNPLYLKIVSEIIRETFSCDIDKFLKVGETASEDIRNPLKAQFSRLSSFEREVLYWLAIEREAISFQNLQTDIASPLLAKTLSEVLNSLRRRSLIENDDASYFLQPVIMEYATEEFTDRVSMEIVRTDINFFGSHALMKALSKDYVRESQRRLILQLLVEKLKRDLNKEQNTRQIEGVLADVLAKVRSRNHERTEYAGGNILNLMLHLNCDLRHADFSGLRIRQAFLQGMKLQDINFSHVDFVESTFTETFGIIISVAFSAKKKLFAASGANGEIRQWHTEEYTPLITYKGHSSWVHAIAFSPDGHILASGGEDQIVRLWDTGNGRCLKTLQHTHKIRSVAFSPGGDTLATSGDDQSIYFWNIATGACTQKLSASTNKSHRTLSIAFSPDGHILASGGNDKTICLWHVDTRQRFLELTGYEGEIRSVTFNREGTLLASGSDDGKVHIWEIDKSQYLLPEHSNEVKSVIFNSDDSVLVSGSDDGKVHIWKIDKSRCLLPEHANRVRSVAFNNGDVLASSSDDQTIRLWDVTSGRCLKTLQGHSSWVGATAFNSDGDVLASGSDDQTIRLWDVTSGRCLKILQGYTNIVESVAFSPDGQVLASGSSDHIIRLWDPQTGSSLKSLHGHKGWIRTIAFSQAEPILASAGDDQTIWLWNLQAETYLKPLHGHTNHIWSISFSPIEPLLASSGEDKTIRLWNIQTGHQAEISPKNTGWIWAITFSPDGTLLASGSDDKVVRIWNVQTEQCVAELHGHSKRIWSVAFNTDGTHLASGSEDESVRIWDIHTHQCIATLPGHNAIVKSIAFLSNEKLVTSDWNLHIWDTSSMDHVDIVTDHADVIRCLAFCSDKNILASSSQDGTVKLWNITTGDCLKTLRNEKLYERMDITGVKGLTEMQKGMLESLGAISHNRF